MRTPLLYPAWLMAAVAMLGSLYFSDVRFFIPCTLCWYQRILMYPLVIILGIAAYKQDAKVTRYALPLSVLGTLIAGFHYLEQKVPWISSSAVCRSGVPCDVQYINWLGFITIPFLSLVAFTIITALLFAVRRSARA
ncbi:MAG: disulfide oxidoreductase [Trueperaceae bacterium]|jgi:disulfide bond formation protein DsbB